MLLLVTWRWPWVTFDLWFGYLSRKQVCVVMCQAAGIWCVFVCLCVCVCLLRPPVVLFIANWWCCFIAKLTHNNERGRKSHSPRPHLCPGWSGHAWTGTWAQGTRVLLVIILTQPLVLIFVLVVVLVVPGTRPGSSSNSGDISILVSTYESRCSYSGSSPISSSSSKSDSCHCSGSVGSSSSGSSSRNQLCK